jgi:hypothetical protein
LDRLGLDRLHLLLVQVAGVGDHHPQDVVVQLHVPLDLGDGGAGRLEVGEDVRAALLPLDLVGELPLVPALEHEDLAGVALDHAADEVQRRGLILGRALAEEEHPLVLVHLRGAVRPGCRRRRLLCHV